MQETFRATLKKMAIGGVLAGLVLSIGPSATRVSIQDAGALGEEGAVGLITERLEMAAKVSYGVRTFGSSGGLELIPCMARDRGFRVVVAGAYLTGNDTHDDIELANIEENVRRGCVTTVVLGANPLQHGWTSEELVSEIRRLKQVFADAGKSGVEVTISDSVGTYVAHPELAKAVDVITMTMQPYFNQDTSGNPTARAATDAFGQTRGTYRYLQSVYPNKKIVIGETGWPIGGATAKATPEFASGYLAHTLSWAAEDDVSLYLYNLVDEPELATYHAALAHFGVFGQNGELKSGLNGVFRGMCTPVPTGPVRSLPLVNEEKLDAAPGCFTAVGLPAPSFAMPRVLGAIDCDLTAAEEMALVREKAVGISNANLQRIPVGLGGVFGFDRDRDTLPDTLEIALGTSPDSFDTDGDKFSDRRELELGYNPTVANGAKLSIDTAFAKQQKGKVLLQVEHVGEAWYVSPADGHRYLFSDSAEARTWACQQ